MRTSPHGVEFIQRWEGCELDAYKDSAGLLTIGVGHLLTRSELSSGKLYIHNKPVHWRKGITHEQARQLLEQDLLPAEDAVNSLDVDLEQHQFDCLVSFAFNVGGGALIRSTLARKLRSGQYAAVPAQLARWVYAGGRIVKGLQNRREAEARLWEYSAY